MEMKSNKNSVSGKCFSGPQARNPNPETRNKPEIRIPNPERYSRAVSDFGLRLSFGFRISGFGFPVHGFSALLALFAAVTTSLQAATCLFDFGPQTSALWEGFTRVT